MQCNLMCTLCTKSHYYCKAMCNALGKAQCNPMCIVLTKFNLVCAIIKVGPGVHLSFCGNMHAVPRPLDNSERRKAMQGMGPTLGFW